MPHALQVIFQQSHMTGNFLECKKTMVFVECTSDLTDSQAYDNINNIWKPDGSSKFSFNKTYDKRRKFNLSWLQKH